MLETGRSSRSLAQRLMPWATEQKGSELESWHFYLLLGGNFNVALQR